MNPKPLFTRHGDKPNQRFENALIELDNGEWMCEPKIDGWRSQIQEFDFGFMVYSGSFEALPLRPEILLEGFPRLGVGTVWDAEWVARRACKVESLMVFGIMYLKNQWQGEIDHEVRRKFLDDTVPDKFLVESWNKGFAKHYEQLKKQPDLYEGVVLKHRKSKIKGDPIRGKNNGFWVKVKFRN